VREFRFGKKYASRISQALKFFHRPHPSPDADKGAVSSTRKWLEAHGVKP